MGCVSHCSNCGRHFHSDAAFDLHRTGPAKDRRCSDPERLKRLKPLTHTGTCNLASGTTKNVTIWQTK